jgi:hypothetical protein
VTHNDEDDDADDVNKTQVRGTCTKCKDSTQTENPSVHVSYPNYQPNVDNFSYKSLELKFV